MSLNVRVTANLDTSKVDMQFNKMMSRISGKQINFNVNGKSFTQPLGRITASANEFTKSLEASNARVIAFGASVGIINAITNSFKALVSEAIKFEKTLADINVILGSSESSINKFGQSLFDVAKNTAQSFDKVADAALEFSRQGLTMEETLKRTNDALILTRLTSLNAEEAVAGLTAAVNAFGDAGLTTTDIIDKLAAVDVKFAVSSEDLINALERTGAVAIDAGVEIDNLIGLVTSLQQTTARGGSVIGNGLKTIFTRIQRPQSIGQIEELGVAVRDLSGAILPADKILLNMAKSFDAMSQSQQSNVVQFSAGIFQANIFRSVLRDLAKDQNIFTKASEVAANASGEAAIKNETLNKTLSALAAQGGVAVEQLAEAIAGLAIKPELGSLLSGFLSVVEGFKDALGGGEGEGNTFAKGFVRGFGNVLTGPALFAFGAVFIKMLANVSKFASQSLKDVLGITTKKDKIKQMEESIVDVLSKNKFIQEALNELEGDRLSQEKFLLKTIEAQTNAMAKQKALAQSLAGGLLRSGVSPDLTASPGDLDGSGTVDGVASKGLVPSYAENTERMGAIKGGYIPGQIKQTNIKGVGNVIYNTAEKIKKFKGMSQPAIMPPSGSKAGTNYKKKFQDTHGFDPYAHRGFVPNFAKLSGSNLKFGKSKLNLFGGAESIARAVGVNYKEIEAEFKKARPSVMMQASLRGIIGSSDKGKMEITGKEHLFDAFSALAGAGVETIERRFGVRPIPPGRQGQGKLSNEQFTERKTKNLLNKEQSQSGHKPTHMLTFDPKTKKGQPNYPTDIIALGDEFPSYEVKSGRFSAANIISKSLRLASDRELSTWMKQHKVSGGKNLDEKNLKKAQTLASKLGLEGSGQGGEFTKMDADEWGMSKGFIPNFKKLYRGTSGYPGSRATNVAGAYWDNPVNLYKDVIQRSMQATDELQAKAPTAFKNKMTYGVDEYNINDSLFNQLRTGVYKAQNVIKLKKFVDNFDLDDIRHSDGIDEDFYDGAQEERGRAIDSIKKQKGSKKIPGTASSPLPLIQELKKGVYSFPDLGQNSEYRDSLLKRDEDQIENLFDWKKTGERKLSPEFSNNRAFFEDMSINGGDKSLRGSMFGGKAGLRQSMESNMGLIPNFGDIIEFERDKILAATPMHMEYFKSFREGETEWKSGQSMKEFLISLYSDYKDQFKSMQEWKGAIDGLQRGDIDVGMMTGSMSAHRGKNMSDGYVPNFGRKTKVNHIELGKRILSYPGDMPTYEHLAKELSGTAGLENVKMETLAALAGEISLKNLVSSAAGIFQGGGNSTQRAFLNYHTGNSKLGKFSNSYTTEEAKELLGAVKNKLKSTREPGYAQKAGIDFEDSFRSHFTPPIAKPPGQPHMDFPAGTLEDLDPSEMSDIFLNTNTGGDAYKGIKGHPREHFISKYLRQTLDQGMKNFDFESTLGSQLLDFAFQKTAGEITVGNEGDYTDILGIDLNKVSGGKDKPNKSVKARESLSSVFKHSKKLKDAIEDEGESKGRGKKNDSPIYRPGQKYINFDYDQDYVQALSGGFVPNYTYWRKFVQFSKGQDGGWGIKGDMSYLEDFTNFLEKDGGNSPKEIDKLKAQLGQLRTSRYKERQSLGYPSMGREGAKHYAKKSALSERAETLSLKGVFLKNLKDKIHAYNDQETRSKFKSGGHIPNFANPLAEAIQRERMAGLPDSKIRIDQDSRLKSKDNPTGLAVINTRDEPGGVGQGIARAHRMGIDPKRHGASAGLVPNFASSEEKLNKVVDELSKSISSLGSTIGNLHKNLKSTDDLWDDVMDLGKVFEDAKKKLEKGDSSGLADVSEKAAQTRARVDKEIKVAKPGKELDTFSRVSEKLRDVEASLGSSSDIIKKESEGRENGLQQLFYMQSAISMANGFLEQFAAEGTGAIQTLSKLGLAASNVTAAYIQQKELIPEFMEMFGTEKEESFSIGQAFSPEAAENRRNAARRADASGRQNSFTRGSRNLASRGAARGGAMGNAMKMIGKAGKGLSFIAKGATRLLPVVGQLYTGFTAVNEAVKFFTGGEGIFDLMASEGTKAAKRIEELGKASEGAKVALESLKKQEEISGKITELEAKGNQRSVVEESKLLDLRIEQIDANAKVISSFEAFNDETKVGQHGVELYSSMVKKFGESAQLSGEQLQEMMRNFSLSTGIQQVIQQLETSQSQVKTNKFGLDDDNDDEKMRAQQGGKNLGVLIQDLFKDVGFDKINKVLEREMKGPELRSLDSSFSLNADDLIKNIVGGSGLIDENAKQQLESGLAGLYQVVEDNMDDFEGMKSVLKGFQSVMKDAADSVGAGNLNVENVKLKTQLKNRISQELKQIKLQKLINQANIKDLSLRNQEIKAREDLLKQYTLMSESISINNNSERKLAEIRASSALKQQDAIDEFNKSLMSQKDLIFNSGTLGADLRSDGKTTQDELEGLQKKFNEKLGKALDPQVIQKALSSINVKLPDNLKIENSKNIENAIKSIQAAKIEVGDTGDEGSSQNALNKMLNTMVDLKPQEAIAAVLSLMEVGLLDQSQELINKLSEMSSTFDLSLIAVKNNLSEEEKKVELARKSSHIQKRTVEGIRYLSEAIDKQGNMSETIKDKLIGQIGHLNLINKNLEERSSTEKQSEKISQLILAEQLQILRNKTLEANSSARREIAQKNINASLLSTGIQPTEEQQKAREGQIEKNFLSVGSDVAESDLKLEEAKIQSNILSFLGARSRLQSNLLNMDLINARNSLLDTQEKKKLLDQGVIRAENARLSVAQEILQKDMSIKDTEARSKLLDSTNLRVLLAEQLNKEELQKLQDSNKDAEASLRRLVISGDINKLAEEQLKQQKISLNKDALIAAAKSRISDTLKQQEELTRNANELIMLSNKKEELKAARDKASMSQGSLEAVVSADVGIDRYGKRSAAREAATRASITGNPEDVLAYSNAMVSLNKTFKEGSGAMDAMRVKIAEINVAAQSLSSDLVNIGFDSIKSEMKEVFKNVGQGMDFEEAFTKMGLSILQKISDRIIDHNLDQMLKNFTIAFTGVDPEKEAKDASRKLEQNIFKNTDVLDKLSSAIEKLAKSIEPGGRSSEGGQSEIDKLSEKVREFAAQVNQTGKDQVTALGEETKATQELIEYYKQTFGNHILHNTRQGTEEGVIAATSKIEAAVKDGVSAALKEQQGKKLKPQPSKEQIEAKKSLEQANKTIQEEKLNQETLQNQINTEAKTATQDARTPENIIRGAVTGQGYDGLDLDTSVVDREVKTVGGRGFMTQYEEKSINQEKMGSNLDMILNAQGIDPKQFRKDNFKQISEEVFEPMGEGDYFQSSYYKKTPDLTSPNFLSEEESLTDVSAPETFVKDEDGNFVSKESLAKLEQIRQLLAESKEKEVKAEAKKQKSEETLNKENKKPGSEENIQSKTISELASSVTSMDQSSLKLSTNIEGMVRAQEAIVANTKELQGLFEQSLEAEIAQLDAIEANVTALGENTSTLLNISSNLDDNTSALLQNIESLGRLSENAIPSLSSSMDRLASAINNVCPQCSGGGSTTSKFFGGRIQAFAEGGFVKGANGEDKVPAMLTAGEYVVPKKDVAAAFKAAKDKFGFNSGGQVSTGERIEAGSKAVLQGAVTAATTAYVSDKINGNQDEQDPPEFDNQKLRNLIGDGGSTVDLGRGDKRLSARFIAEDKNIAEYGQHLMEKHDYDVQQQNKKVAKRMQYAQMGVSSIMGMATSKVMSAGSAMFEKYVGPYIQKAKKFIANKVADTPILRHVLPDSVAYQEAKKEYGELNYTDFKKEFDEAKKSDLYQNYGAVAFRGKIMDLGDIDTSSMTQNGTADAFFNAKHDAEVSYLKSQKRDSSKQGTAGYFMGGSVPAMLTAGESVIPADNAKRIGYANLDTINKTGSLPTVKGPGGIDNVGPVPLNPGDFVLRRSTTQKLNNNPNSMRFSAANPGMYRKGGEVAKGYYNGGVVEPGASGVSVPNRIKEPTTSSIYEQDPISDTMGVGQGKSESRSGDVTNNININVKIDQSGGSTENVSASAEGSYEKEKELSMKIKTAVLDVIRREKRIGGELSE